MALFIDRARTHTHTSSLFSILWTPQAGDTSTLFSWIAPSIYMLYPGLYFTHIAYVTFLIDPPKTLTNPHTILSLYFCISLTQPHVGGVRIQEENRCTVHVLTLRAQPHPRGYTVELISLRNGSPRANLNACSGCLPTEVVYHACTKQSST